MVTIVSMIQHIYTNNSCASSQGLVLKYNLWKFSWEIPLTLVNYWNHWTYFH